MHEISRRRWAAAAIVFFTAAGLASAQAVPSLKEILRKNLEASGGKAKIGRVKNLSFKAGGTRYVVSAAGELMVFIGKDPIVTEIVRVRGGKAERKSLNGTSEIADPQKTSYLTLAKIYAGVFSLAKFDGELVLDGVRSFGPEKLYHLTARGKSGPVAVHFYLRTDDFSLKRLVFQGATAEGDKHEVNYDFAPFEDVEGLRMPLSWFASQVGTRGTLTEVAEVKTNEPLAAGFFSAMELNAGTVKVGPGSLEGNVLDVNPFPDGLMAATNWTKKDVEQAGLKSGDKLTLRGGDQGKGFVASVILYTSAGEVPPPAGQLGEIRILAPAPRGGETLVLQLRGSLTPDMTASLKVLAPISVEKTTK